jgi:hypothetical protein
MIAGVVADEYEILEPGRIRTYIPTLIENGARNRLRSVIAHSEDI